jgi:hypothetical protein
MVMAASVKHAGTTILGSMARVERNQAIMREKQPNRAHLRRLRAIDRKAARALRSDAEQLQALNDRGHGHCREAARLRIIIGLGVES